MFCPSLVTLLTWQFKTAWLSIQITGLVYECIHTWSKCNRFYLAWWREGEGPFSSRDARLHSAALLGSPNYVISHHRLKFLGRITLFKVLTFLGLNYLTVSFPDQGCGKFALRALSQCLAREFQPMGVHVAHVIIDGVVGPPRFSSSLLCFTFYLLRPFRFPSKWFFLDVK